MMQLLINSVILQNLVQYYELNGWGIEKNLFTKTVEIRTLSPVSVIKGSSTLNFPITFSNANITPAISWVSSSLKTETVHVYSFTTTRLSLNSTENIQLSLTIKGKF